MNIETWLTFSVAAAILLAIPGPTILLVITQSVSQGARAAVPLVAGVAAGDFTAMTVSLLGLGAIMATSAVLFNILKWAGAIYLIWLGYQMWRDAGKQSTSAKTLPKKSVRRLFIDAYLVTTFNPKGIVFFIAFFPQFIDAGGNVLTQTLILGGTFLTMATLGATLYAVFASSASRYLLRGTSKIWFNRCGGSALIGAGAFTAAIQRS